MNGKIRILLANQIRLLGNVITAVLEEEPDMEVVGNATNAAETLRLAHQADVVLVNTRMSDGSALELIRALAGADLAVKILALGLAESSVEILQYIQAGAVGYVLADDSVEDMLQRIRDACAGRVRVSPEIASALVTRVAEYARLLNHAESSLNEITYLTQREREILELVGQGLTNQQIAERLVIELGTVKNHVHNILHKLGGNSRHEAAVTWSLLKGSPGDAYIT
jgi:DNA-binding NarL/FixJ family response regulator